MRTLGLAVVIILAGAAAVTSQIRLVDDNDRQALRNWFVVLVDAQFYRPTPDVTDCAGLVRHATREALKPHSPEWLRLLSVPGMPTFADVRKPPRPRDGVWSLFRVSEGGQYGEFADARTIIRFNSTFVSRSLAAARPGDLLYFRQASGTTPDHLMVFVGRSAFDRTASDWIVYHTGPDGPSAGEMRKVRLADLSRHPAARWRPVSENSAFVGIFRLTFL
jgi:uncharacterized protein